MPFDTHHYKHRISFWSATASLAVVLIFMGGIGGLGLVQALDPPVTLGLKPIKHAAMFQAHVPSQPAPTVFESREDALSREVIEHQIEIQQLMDERRETIRAMKETNDKLQQMSDEHAMMKGFSLAGGALIGGLQVLSMFFQLRRRVSER